MGIIDESRSQAASAGACLLLARARESLVSTPFVPHRVLAHGDAQTIGAHFWPGRFPVRDRTSDEERLFHVEPGSRVLARCRWQRERAGSPTLLLWHGIEGSAASSYMVGTAGKAFRAGFNVVRLNVRNCGGTEHLSPTLYHGGLTGDLRAVVEELIEQDRLQRLCLAGFSLGGNMVLKLTGEYGDNPPPQLKAICAVSPAIDLSASSRRLSRRRRFLYHHEFLWRLKRRVRVKERLFPRCYCAADLRHVRSIEDFDERFTAPSFGFCSAGDYYAQASSLPWIGRIRVPSLIIHAVDDPVIPFAPLLDPAIAANPHVLLHSTARGGHVGFISQPVRGEDRFWAENRLVQFCGLGCSDARGC